MDLRVVDRVLSTFIIPTRPRRIRVVFSGGEPLLLPLSWFRKAIGLLRSVDSSGISFGVQTNGTVLTPEHIDFFKEYNIQISVSLDGPPRLNDTLRGKGIDVIRNFRLLLRNEIDVGVITLISPSTWNRTGEVYDFLRELKVRKVRFNTFFPIGRAATMSPLSTQQLFSARRTILEGMFASGGEGPLDRNLLEQVRWFLNPPSRGWPPYRRGCGGFFCPAGESLFSLNPEGDIYPCSDITFTRPDFRLGSIFDEWGEGMSDDMVAILDQFHAKGLWWRRCQGCDAAVICDYGCPAFAGASPRGVNLECNATRLLWLHLNQCRNDVVVFAKKLGLVKSSTSSAARSFPEASSAQELECQNRALHR